MHFWYVPLIWYASLLCLVVSFHKCQTASACSCVSPQQAWLPNCVFGYQHNYVLVVTLLLTLLLHPIVFSKRIRSVQHDTVYSIRHIPLRKKVAVTGISDFCLCQIGHTSWLWYLGSSGCDRSWEKTVIWWDAKQCVMMEARSYKRFGVNPYSSVLFCRIYSNLLQ